MSDVLIWVFALSAMRRLPGQRESNRYRGFFPTAGQWQVCLLLAFLLFPGENERDGVDVVVHPPSIENYAKSIVFVLLACL